MNPLIQKLIARENLSEAEAHQAIHFLLDDHTANTQKAALLVLLRSKGETLTELSAYLKVLRANRQAIALPYPVIDFVGTGGDGLQTVNISTASALLAAACGLKTLKHGNRAVSSLAGSADVLTALGIDIDLTTEQVKQSIDSHHFAFCFAPHYQPLLKKLAPLRQEIKVPTTLNLLGPLLNPAEKTHLLLGVADEKLCAIYAQLLIKQNSPRSVIVHQQGLDELSCLGPAHLIEVNGTTSRSYQIDPEHLGLRRCRLEDLLGKDAAYNAAYIQHTFSGEETGLTDTLIFNVAMGLSLCLPQLSLSDAVSKARTVLRSGKVNTLLEHCRSKRYA